MRRARIKVMATVPVRRRPMQDTKKVDQNDETEDKNKEIATQEVPIKCDENSHATNDHVELRQEHAENINLESNKTLTAEKDAVKPENEPEEKKVQSSENSTNVESTSPQKTVPNRSCFMRPIPRFDSGGRIRRNSVQGSGASASESEDDSKRATLIVPNRIRNDSVCSVQSNKEVCNNITPTNNITVIKTGQKRRMMVSESARKLAEARREFLLKHENKTPDRSKLTMYDLIYYNPVTNPMKRSREGAQTQRKISEVQTAEVEEEHEDDLSAMPVPQVKVGPDGQLIIDEQSLVIEQTDAKRSKEILSKEVIVDEDTNGSGFYKRRQKSKEWPKWETLKFYKALNTVGTDFLLMQSLFPKRTRQEIKLKYKKEEKVNRKLIEKALIYHQEFDIDMLEKELATFEETEKDREKQKQSEGKDKKRSKRIKKRLRRIVASSIEEMDATEDEEEPECAKTAETCEIRSTIDSHRQQKAKKQNTQNNKKSVDDSLHEVADSEFGVENDSDSGTEFYRVRPTRSGRVPKVKKLQAPDVNRLDNATSDCNTMDCDNSSDEEGRLTDTLSTVDDAINTTPTTKSPDLINAAIPDINNVKPGSLVILSKESPEEPGNTVLQVYMVSSNMNSGDQVKQNITPIELSPELLATVTTKLADGECTDINNERE